MIFLIPPHCIYYKRYIQQSCTVDAAIDVDFKTDLENKVGLLTTMHKDKF